MTRAEILQVAKPILFNTDMVTAILEGRKTVTRRVCKDGNDYTVPDMGYYDADKRTYAIHSYCDKRCTYEYQISTSERKVPICPGDILYVRETWNWYPIEMCSRESYIYRADFTYEKAGYVTWKPSLHMPKEAARIFLKVKDVRVERLQEIDDKGAYMEGAGEPNIIYQLGARVCEFARIWQSTIKKEDIDKYGWDANPWVWVIEFERIELDCEV